MTIKTHTMIMRFENRKGQGHHITWLPSSQTYGPRREKTCLRG